MDAYIATSGSARHVSWYPNHDSFIASLSHVPDTSASSAQSPANEGSLGSRSGRAQVVPPENRRRTMSRDGYAGHYHSHFPRPTTGGVMLPSLSETRLLSRPIIEARADHDSGTLPLSRLSGSGFIQGGESGVATQDAPVNTTGPNSSFEPMTSPSATFTPQARVVSNEAVAWRQATTTSSFTDIYQFPERRWRRVYDRSFANYGEEDDVQNPADSRSLASSARSVAGLSPDPSTRPVQHHLRRRNQSLSQASMSNSSSRPSIGSESGLMACRLAALNRDLEKKIQCALFHSEFDIKRPFPAAKVESLEDKSCSICYNDYGIASPEGVIEEPIKLPGCGHVFGSHCLGTWLRSKNNWKCPMCRAKINPRVDNHYDLELWLEYQRLKDTLENRESLAFLHRIVASKERPPPPVVGLVVEPRINRRRPAPDSSRESQQRRVRFRYSEPQESLYGRGRPEDPQAVTPGAGRLPSASTSRRSATQSNQEESYGQHSHEHLRDERELPPMAAEYSESSWAVPASSFPGYDSLEPLLPSSFIPAELRNPLRSEHRMGQPENTEAVSLPTPLGPFPYLQSEEVDEDSAFLHSETSSEDEE